ncbi:hypothetical protein FRB94_003362 [Tulasnella sp. JGI-2019a]|nr:hypothetical protein FRB94_003362 [Tulasnella sp. JGI-2019a]
MKAIMEGTLPESATNLKSPLNLWPVVDIFWKVNPTERATGNAVLKELIVLTDATEDTDITSVAHELYARFELDSDNTDLDAAIEYQQEVLQFQPPGHPDRSDTVQNTALYMHTRFMIGRNRADLDTAVSYQHEVVQLRPVGHPDRSTSIKYMALYIFGRFKEEKDRADLDAAIGYMQEAVKLQPPGDPNRPGTIRALATFLNARYQEDRDPTDLKEVFRYQQEAVQVHSLRMHKSMANSSVVVLPTGLSTGSPALAS